MEICVAHRVPPYRIGWAMTGSLGQTTAKEMNEMYKRSIIEPGQEILEHRLNNQLFRVFAEILGGLDWYFKLNEIDTDDREADMQYAADGYEKRILTRNESRKVVGYEPVADGDTFFEGGTAASQFEAIAKSADDEQENIIAINTFRKSMKKQRRLCKRRQLIFSGQGNRLLNLLPVIPIKKADEEIDLVIAEAEVDEFLDSVDWDEERQMFVDEVTDTLQDDVTEFVQSAIASNGLTWMVLDPIGDIAAKWVAAYAFELAKGIHETTKDRLRETMLKNLSEGMGVDALSVSIADVMSEASNYRAMMIARTETTYAMNYGNLIAYKGANRNKKTWLTGNDERVCKECGGLHGETVDIDDLFSNGKMCPPAHPHCRCTMISEE